MVGWVVVVVAVVAVVVVVVVVVATATTVNIIATSAVANNIMYNQPQALQGTILTIVNVLRI